MDRERGTLAERQKVLEEKGVQFVADLGQGIFVAKVPIEMFREQDINARIMEDAKFKQLVNNIKKRGTLESLPLCTYTSRGIEIISGHHRIKAARTAGLKTAPTLLDMSELNRSQIAAKQLAHNAICGVDDQNTLREIAKLITDVDDMLESAIDESIFKEQMQEIERLATPSVDIDWKTVQFTFLPHQLKDLNRLVEKTVGTDTVGIVGDEQFSPFVEALEKTKRFDDVKAVGTAVYVMIKTALEKLGEYNEDEDYVTLASMFGGGAVTKECADTVNRAMKKMRENGEIGDKKSWEAIEVLAKKYLGE